MNIKPSKFLNLFGLKLCSWFCLTVSSFSVTNSPRQRRKTLRLEVGDRSRRIILVAQVGTRGHLQIMSCPLVPRLQVSHMFLTWKLLETRVCSSELPRPNSMRSGLLPMHFALHLSPEMGPTYFTGGSWFRSWTQTTQELVLLHMCMLLWASQVLFISTKTVLQQLFHLSGGGTRKIRHCNILLFTTEMLRPLSLTSVSVIEAG